jgi:hypothetical protein
LKVPRQCSLVPLIQARDISFKGEQENNLFPSRIKGSKAVLTSPSDRGQLARERKDKSLWSEKSKVLRCGLFYGWRREFDPGFTSHDLN